MKRQGVRALVYCQDSLGLGHLRRNINIAHEMSRQAPDTTFLFIADSPSAPFFKLPPNSDFIKLKSIEELIGHIFFGPNFVC